MFDVVAPPVFLISTYPLLGTTMVALRPSEAKYFKEMSSGILLSSMTLHTLRKISAFSFDKDVLQIGSASGSQTITVSADG